jgi:hypothetical protein
MVPYKQFNTLWPKSSFSSDLWKLVNPDLELCTLYLNKNVGGLAGSLTAGLVHHDSRVGQRVPHTLNTKLINHELNIGTQRGVTILNLGLDLDPDSSKYLDPDSVNTDSKHCSEKN